MQQERDQVNDVTFTLYCDLTLGEPQLLEIETDNRNRVITKKLADRTPYDVEKANCRNSKARLKKVRDAQFHLVLRDTSNSGVSIDRWELSFEKQLGTSDGSPFGGTAGGDKTEGVRKGSYTEYQLTQKHAPTFVHAGTWQYWLDLRLPDRGPVHMDPEMEVDL